MKVKTAPAVEARSSAVSSAEAHRRPTYSTVRKV